MHEELYHSPERPFRATPDIRYYFAHDSVEAARQTVVRAVLRAEGPVMVLGGAGLGKSLLGTVVVKDFAARFDIVQLHAARLCSRRALLQSILFELDLPYRDLSEGELRLSILARLEPSSDHAPDGVVIVVDEAHTLPAKLLDELRLISNFTRANQPRARLVLIGNLRLEDIFAEPQLESFNQRLAARCYLQPMNRQQTRQYVFHQLTTAGFNPKELITEDATQAVYAASDGVPRLVNQIMDHALALAATGNQCPISSSLVEEAWADLQQLPAPWHAGADKSPSQLSTSPNAASTVEFGVLDGDDDWGTASEMVVEPPQQPSTTTPTNASRPRPEQSLSVRPSNSSEACDGNSDDSDDELRLADEPMESGATPRTGNFFAAFVPADDLYDKSYADSFDDESTELNLAPEALRFTDEPSDSTEIGGKLTAKTDPLKLAGEDSLGFQNLQAGDSFFRNRPTDEQLLALQDEQQGYDAMGVWENDPPLAGHSEEKVCMDQANEHSPIGSNELFGNDFDEEVSLTAVDAKSFKNTPAVSSNPMSNDKRPQKVVDAREGDLAARQAAETADYIGRIQQFADIVASTNRGQAGRAVPTVDEILAESEADWGENQLVQSTGLAALDTWSFDVATIDVRQEQAVQVEIEDLVSQLNFSAFSMEPFSVEQIALDPSDQRQQPPHDSSRSGKNDEIYTMHRPNKLLPKDLIDDDFLRQNCDDDRDLLILEEELAQASNTADESQTPITKIAPYSQLFAKLRK
ncbi:MAG: AAA family ATPase [Pirellulaceae bacterium]|jgi:type II secretory pathway predicted ATPase ExeA|nr:AAA family ATPase [Pirellulaceae bacterium]